MLEANDLTLMRGNNILLEKASFRVNLGEKVGLVGVNGAGKTTLLKTMYGELEPEGGTITRPEKIGYLGQERLADALQSMGSEETSVLTIGDYLLAARGLGEITTELRAIEKKLEEVTAPDASPEVAATSDAILQRYGDLEERYGMLGGYEAESEIVQLLRGLGMATVELDRPLSALSGGQKTRVAIARLFFGAPDLLLLDEPTNHLDVKATRWLMDYLSRYQGTVILISHDLPLLDAAIKRVFYLDKVSRSLAIYTGNYTSFEKQKQQNEDRLVKETGLKTAHIARLQEQANWMRGKTEKVARRAKVLDRTIERMSAELPDPAVLPQRQRVFTMDLPVVRQSGHMVCRVSNLNKSFGTNNIFSNLNFEIERKQRMVIIGQNGAGKTTLLRVMAGRMPASTGNVNMGHNVDLGYYAQEHDLLHPDMTLLEEMLDASYALDHKQGPPPGERQLRTILGRFLFSNDKVFQKVKTLSGGEKTRLALARLMLGGFNTLLLDEPTNNLDMASRDHILKALSTYSGTLIVVSHDPEFVQALQPEYALMLPEGTVRYYDDAMLDLVAKT